MHVYRHASKKLSQPFYQISEDAPFLGVGNQNTVYLIAAEDARVDQSLT
jgi:hypothetical protein